MAKQYTKADIKKALNGNTKLLCEFIDLMFPDATVETNKKRVKNGKTKSVNKTN